MYWLSRALYRDPDGRYWEIESDPTGRYIVNEYPSLEEWQRDRGSESLLGPSALPFGKAPLIAEEDR